MKKISPPGFLVLIFLIINSCIFSSEEDKYLGDYTYTAFDSSGVKIITGSMEINFQDSTSLTGKWKFSKIKSVNYAGPQIGSGDLQGSVSDNQISINLNPGWADNNVVLRGRITESKITGTWSWITFVGPTSSANFEAKIN